MNIVFDIGGTKMRLAKSEDGVTFGDPVIVETPKDFDAGMSAFHNAFLSLANGERPSGIAGGIAGALSRDKSILLKAPNLQGWEGKPIKEALTVIAGCPVHLENDAAMVGLGEAVVGPGQGAEIVVYITISTGVGGVRIVNGKIDMAAQGFEPGHQIIDAGGALRTNSVGGHGTDFEGLISGSAITERYGKKPYEITDVAFWDEMARLTAFGLNNTIVHWSPDVVVLGGSMMKEIGIPVDRVREYLKGILHIFSTHPRIEHSALGDFGGLHGALAYLRNVNA